MFKSDTFYLCVLSFHISKMVEIPRCESPPLFFCRVRLALNLLSSVVYINLLVLLPPPPKC